MIDFRLEYDPWGRMVYSDADGRRESGVTVVRAFPIGAPDHWISICDSQGHEILCIEDLAQVPPEVRVVLESELSRREFVPIIQRILSATPEEPSQWSVETDRGPTEFQINNEDDVRRIEPHQASILDSHGVRYLVPDVRKLDAQSRRLLEHFL
jgi:hypothetical protein